MKRSGWAVVYATNGSKLPIVEIDSVYKTKKEAESKLKWLNPKGDNYKVMYAPLMNLIKEQELAEIKGKAIPLQSVLYHDGVELCPKCRTIIRQNIARTVSGRIKEVKYCHHCGQAIELISLIEVKKND